MSVNNINVSLVTIESDGGHDSFLLRNEILEKTLNGILLEN
ncbi:MAG: hypothetical protein ACO26G_03550 [Rickettsiales bacterium]